MLSIVVFISLFVFSSGFGGYHFDFFKPIAERHPDVLANSILFIEVFIKAFSGIHTSAHIRKSTETSIDESKPVFS